MLWIFHIEFDLFVYIRLSGISCALTHSLSLVVLLALRLSRVLLSCLFVAVVAAVGCSMRHNGFLQWLVLLTTSALTRTTHFSFDVDFPSFVHWLNGSAGLLVGLLVEWCSPLIRCVSLLFNISINANVKKMTGWSLSSSAKWILHRQTIKNHFFHAANHPDTLKKVREQKKNNKREKWPWCWNAQTPIYHRELFMALKLSRNCNT